MCLLFNDFMEFFYSYLCSLSGILGLTILIGLLLAMFHLGRLSGLHIILPWMQAAILGHTEPLPNICHIH